MGGGVEGVCVCVSVCVYVCVCEGGGVCMYVCVEGGGKGRMIEEKGGGVRIAS